MVGVSPRKLDLLSLENRSRNLQLEISGTPNKEELGSETPRCGS